MRHYIKTTRLETGTPLAPFSGAPQTAEFGLPFRRLADVPLKRMDGRTEIHSQTVASAGRGRRWQSHRYPASVSMTDSAEYMGDGISLHLRRGDRIVRMLGSDKVVERVQGEGHCI
jgi:hypothetical protein